VAATLLTQLANGGSIGNLTSFQALSAGARRLTSLRYGGELKSPPIATVLLGIGYAGAMAGPFAAGVCRGRLARTLVVVAPTTAAAYYTTATTARAPFLIAACITLASWLATAALRGGGRPRFSGRHRVAVSLAGAAVLGTFILATLLRAGATDARARSLVLDRIAVYSVGSVPALETRLDEQAPIYLGRLLLEGVLSVFAPAAELYTAHPPFVSVGSGLQTNVFTSFWPLTQDFGLPGALLVSTVFVFIAAAALRAAVVNRSIGAACVYIIWVSFTLFSQTTLIFSFTNVVLAFGVGAAVLRKAVRLLPADPSPSGLSTEHYAVDARRAALEQRSPAPIGHARVGRTISGTAAASHVPGSAESPGSGLS
jgi:hypothetical protein